MIKRWCEAGEEPTLEDVLADPIVHMVARRDGLSARDVQNAASEARLSLGRRRSASTASFEEKTLCRRLHSLAEG